MESPTKEKYPVYTTPGTRLPNGAVVIEVKEVGRDHVSVFALWNTVTPWVIWRDFDVETGQCYSGTYYYDDQFTQATDDWRKA